MIKLNDIERWMADDPKGAAKLIQAAAAVEGIVPRRLEKNLDFQSAIGKGGLAKWGKFVEALDNFIPELPAAEAAPTKPANC